MKALKDLGADLVAIHTEPDGTNINANCGSTHMDELKARVVYEKHKRVLLRRLGESSGADL